MKLERFSMGLGDRFLHQGRAQLQAIINAKQAGVAITPVWNKSDREHVIVGTEPVTLREEADAAVSALGWDGPYRVDADHINLSTVGRFIDCSDFFTIDVGDAIGLPADDLDIAGFVVRNSHYIGELHIPGSGTHQVTQQAIEQVAAKFHKAVKLAGRIYRRILERHGDDFIPDNSDCRLRPAVWFLEHFARFDIQRPTTRSRRLKGNQLLAGSAIKRHCRHFARAGSECLGR